MQHEDQQQQLPVDDHVPTLTARDNGEYYDVDCSCGEHLGDRRMPINDAWKSLWWEHAAREFRTERDQWRSAALEWCGERDRARAKMMEFAQRAGVVSFDA